MWRYLLEIERNPGRISGIRIWSGRIFLPIRNVAFREPLHTQRFEALVNAAQILDRDRVDRKPAHQRPPLCRHVRNRKPRVHRKRCHSRPRKLDRGVQAFVVVIEAAQGNDDVLACDALR